MRSFLLFIIFLLCFPPLTAQEKPIIPNEPMDTILNRPFDFLENPNEFDPELLSLPVYPGGIRNLNRKFGEIIRYPKVAQKEGIEGRVIVGFVVETDGNISNLEVLHEIGGGCGQEAMRALKKVGKWQSGLYNGQKVKLGITLPIYFKLN